MLLASASVGVMAGLFISLVHLKLGMPGHKAFFWMTPVLVARLLGKCKVGSTAGGSFAALTTYSMGANLAGDIGGIGMIIIAGMVLDWAASLVEKNRISGIKMILLLGIAGMGANLLCLGKRMVLPTGLSPHYILGMSGFWFRLVSYTFFGLLSGVTASVIARSMMRKAKS